MTKPLVRSDMASEAVRRPKQPRRICLKKSGVSMKLQSSHEFQVQIQSFCEIAIFSQRVSRGCECQNKHIKFDKSDPPYFRRMFLRSGTCLSVRGAASNHYTTAPHGRYRFACAFNFACVLVTQTRDLLNFDSVILSYTSQVPTVNSARALLMCKY